MSLGNLKEEHNRALLKNKLLNYGSEIRGNIEADIFKQLVTLKKRYGTYSEFAKVDFKTLLNIQDLKDESEEQKDQLKKGGGAGAGMPPDVDKLKQDLQKSKKEVQEAAVERERFQSQLEMLVQELEQKQVWH